MFPSAVELLAWLSFGGAALSAVQMWALDRQLQAFRHPQAARSSFLFVPVRWQQELYTAEGQALVVRAWKACARMVGFFLLAAILFLIHGSAA